MTVPLFWHHSVNFGDALAPWLVRKISGQDAEPVDWRWDHGAVPYFVTGSIFSHQVTRGIIWGAGCAFEDDLNPAKMPAPSAELRVVATRGPLSKKLVEATGHKPVACGDPGILLPRFYEPKEAPRRNVGILCSWVDHRAVYDAYYPDIPVLDASNPIETVIDKICSWDVVVSSSLHGLVAAAAYGKPFVWASFSDKMIGDGFKYRDFFASLGVERPRCAKIDLDSSLARVIRGIQPLIYDFDPPDDRELLKCCPFVDG